MSSKPTLLLAGPEAQRRDMTAYLGDAGLQILESEGGSQVPKLMKRRKFDVLLLDAASSGGSAAATAVRKLKKIDPCMQIIVIATGPHPESVVNAVDGDAFDFLEWPAKGDRLIRAVRHAVEQRRLLLQVDKLTQRLKAVGDVPPANSPKKNGSAAISPTSPANALVGSSKVMREVRRHLAQVADSDMTVLISGETGTGKGVAARVIHEMSGRASKGVFIKINCPAIPEQLFESELFGHESGAFTGALKCKPGQFEMAEGGTIFLDEIGDLPIGAQTKLLQVLEDKEFTRVGGNKTIKADVRILAATNAIRGEDLSHGDTLRTDLFFRLNQYAIHISPLRERIEDILVLADYFLKKYSQLYGNSGLSISPETESLLIRHPWPGNVRELETIIRRYALAGKEEQIPSILRQRQDDDALKIKSKTWQETEKTTILSALAETRWNRRRAALMLNMSYNTLRRRIAQYNLSSSI